MNTRPPRSIPGALTTELYGQGYMAYLGDFDPSTSLRTSEVRCKDYTTQQYIGPIKVLWWDTTSDTYMLDLPTELKAQQIHPMFHIRVLRQHEPNDDMLFPKQDAQAFYDVGNEEEVKWVIDEVLAHRWAGTKVEFLVNWNLGDSTWEPYAIARILRPLTGTSKYKG